MRNRTAILAALALAISGVSIGCQNDNNNDSRGARVDRIGLDPRDTSELDSTQNVAGARTGVGHGGGSGQDSTGMTNSDVGEPLTTDVQSTPAAGTMTQQERDARQRSIDSTRLDQNVAGGGVAPGTSARGRDGTTTGRENTDQTTQQRDTTADRDGTRVIELDDNDGGDAVGAGVRIEGQPAPRTTNDRTNNNDRNGDNTGVRQPAPQPTGTDRAEQNRTGAGQNRSNSGGSTTRPSN